MTGADPGSFTSFGELLKYLRTRARMSQRELGVAVGYSDAQITRLENGKRQPDPAAVRARFIEALDLQDEPALAQRLIDLAAAADRGIPAELKHTPIPNPPAGMEQRTNLPVQFTRFIGREREITEVTALVRANRLVTLTGAGGVGKTRLAIQVAASFTGADVVGADGRPPLPAFPDGVWLVELAPLSDPAGVPRAVADALHLKGEMGHPLTDALVEHLAGRRLLLLLDNCEHLIGACAETVEQLLSTCPDLYVLTTSREALELPGEVVWRVPSLTTPAADSLPPLVKLAGYEAVRLFVNRAAAVQPGFELTPANAAAVAQVCKRLDGIPLAIEMAAALVSAMSVGEMAVALDDMFALLSSGKRTALERQQTLRATLDWSYALLSLPERVLLARLAVFAGGWTLETAKAVCVSDDMHSAPGILPLLLKLVHKSLVVATHSDGSTRYHLLEPIRQYAAEKLRERGSDEVTTARERHWSCFVAIGEAEEADDWREFDAWVGRLDAEHDNLRAAFDYARTRARDDGGERMLRLARAANTLLLFFGYLDESRAWLDEALERGREGPLRVRARALEARARVAESEGDSRTQLRFVDASLELFRQIDYPFAMGWALQQRADLAVNLENDLQRSLAYHEEALEQFKRTESSYGIAASLRHMGGCWVQLGETGKAQSALEEAWRAYESMANYEWGGNALRWLARVDGQKARHLFERAIAGLSETTDKKGLVDMLQWLAVTLMEAGDNEHAIPVLHECLQLLDRIGGGRLLEMIRAGIELDLGLAEYRLGRIDAALQHHEQAFRTASDTGFAPGFRVGYDYFLAWYSLARGERDLAERYSLEGLRNSRSSGNGVLVALQLAQQAEILHQRGDLSPAARIAGAAATAEKQVYLGDPWPAPWVEYQQVLASLRALTGAPDLAVAWAEGQHMTLDQAIECALAG